MRISAVPAQRRHTLYFLEQLRSFSPVFLDTDVDMTRVLAHRAEHQLSIVTYVLHAVGRVLAAHPDANAAIQGNRLGRSDRVNAKLTLDKTLQGQRVVLAAVLPDVHTASLDEIQTLVKQHKDADPATSPAFAKLRTLHRMPPAVGRVLFRIAGRSLASRPDMAGTVAVTSLGNQPVNGFHSIGGTTVTVGVGQVAQRPVVRDGQIVAAPVMRLNLTFDHRVIDGAEAAEVLTEIKQRLEAR